MKKIKGQKEGKQGQPKGRVTLTARSHKLLQGFRILPN